MATLPKASQFARPLSQVRRVAQMAEAPALVEAQRWFIRERSWINELHLQLCRIPAPTFFERTRAEWFRQQLEALDWQSSLDRAGNVLAAFGDPQHSRPIIVSAHLDTVFSPSRPEEVYFAPDGRLVGPGVSDNGSGLTALLALARLLASHAELHELASSILLVANVGEEGEGNLSGMRYLCQSLVAHSLGSQAPSAIKAFLVLDGPSVEHVTAQALASRRYEVTFSGTGGHSWNDHGTPNPVHVLSHLVSSFVESADARFTDARLLEQRRNHCSYNFSVMEGGSSINAIPAGARAKLDIRSEDSGILEELSTLLTSTVERSLEHGNRTARTSRLSAKIRDLGSRPGGKLPGDSPLLRNILAVDTHLNIRSRVDCASTDANVPLSLGLPAISIGAGGSGGGAHTAGEWYQPDGRELGLRRIFLLLTSLFYQNQELSGTASQNL